WEYRPGAGRTGLIGGTDGACGTSLRPLGAALKSAAMVTRAEGACKDAGTEAGPTGGVASVCIYWRVDARGSLRRGALQHAPRPRLQRGGVRRAFHRAGRPPGPVRHDPDVARARSAPAPAILDLRSGEH